MWFDKPIPKPKSKFNGIQDMNGINKVDIVPAVIKPVETEADRVAEKLARTREIVSKAQEESQAIKSIPKCGDCVWCTSVTSGSSTVSRCRQPLVSNMRVDSNGDMKWDNISLDTARGVTGQCGPRKDLFTAKTWWEANGSNLITVAVAALVLALIAGLVGVLIHFVGWENVCVGFAIVGVVGFFLIMAAGA